jgi:hypothetical protein
MLNSSQLACSLSGLLLDRAEDWAAAAIPPPTLWPSFICLDYEFGRRQSDSDQLAISFIGGG